MIKGKLSSIFDQIQIIKSFFMKKNILIFCAVITTFSLMAFSFYNWNKPEQIKKQEPENVQAANYYYNVMNNIINEKDLNTFIFNVDHRYNSTLVKEELKEVKTVFDILPEASTKSVESFQNSRISILNEENEITEVGTGGYLTIAQLNLLKSLDYSTNIRVSSICKRKNDYNDILRNDSIVYYMTIVPEKPAKFKGEYKDLITYFRDNSKEQMKIVERDKIKPGQVSFTVTKNGSIENVKLSSTVGFPLMDEKVLELVSKMKDKWDPATNSEGEKVNQKLILFFGTQGC